MKVKVKLFDKSLPPPKYKTKGSCAADLCSRQDILVKAKEINYIPLNVAVEIPDGYVLIIAARSSTHKLGLIIANGIGVGDRDFCGDNDEYKLIVFNYTDNDVLIKKGMRVAQMFVLGIEKMDIEIVDSLNNSDRGGIGSTGVY